MSTGISTNVSIRTKAACLAAAGIKFAIRYYSRPGSPKAITVAEANAIAAAGIQLGVVYQENGRSIGEFTPAKARAHAMNAWRSAQAINQPAGSAIYFAVDYDATVADLHDVILPYFNEVASTLAEAAGGTNPYHLGVYGSGRSCRYLKKNAPAVRYTWLTVSKGWADSRTYNEWDVNQTWGEGNLCGLTPVYVSGNRLYDGDYEYNYDDGDFGGFFPGVPITDTAQVAALASGLKDIEFKMELGGDDMLRTGILVVRGSGNKILLEAVATSGRPGHQNAGHQWETGTGLLPAVKDLKVSTEALLPESNSQLGVRFHITPRTLTNPATNHSRSGFSIHGAESQPGTGGGISILHSNDYTEFRRILGAAATAGTTSLPLKIIYTGGIQNLSIPAARKLEAVFSLKLKKSSKLQWGSFTITDENGHILYSGVATSGVAGHQHADAFWTVGRGVVPPTGDNRYIQTAVWNTNLPMGTRYQITPETVWNADRTKSRTEFRVHFDSGSPGSAGCIVTPDRRDYDKIITLFAALRARGVKQIPLILDYT